MIKNCYLLVVVLCLLKDSQARTYERVKDYNKYVSLWQSKKDNVIVHDVSKLGAIKDQCDSETCKFFYYEYKEKQQEWPYNRTVLMVAGMHGNEFLGPHVLLYGFQHFKGARIIYFPVANPSGFQRSERLTFPQKLDPNRDYPIDGNTNCYQTYSTLVLDHIFRKYPIDITFVLHNGGNEIGFNWGTFQHRSNSHTQDYDIQLAISEMMSRVAGSNQDLKMERFKVGTMSEIIYPATGTFDDWAFAASKYPSLVTKCKNHNFQPYPANMTNGLVFLIELGPQNNDLLGSSQAVKLGSTSSKDGYVSRGIRMLKSGLEIVNPWLSMEVKQNTASLLIHGCSNAQIDQLDIVQHISEAESRLLFSSNKVIQVQGTVRKDKPRPNVVQFQQKLQNTKSRISYRGNFTCSKEWIGKGTTFFATSRKYPFDRSIDLGDEKFGNTQMGDGQEVNLKWYEYPEVKEYSLYLVIVITVLVLMSAIFAVLRCICAVKTVKKQERTQYQEEQMQTGQDLHTARGGIINQNM